MRRFKKMFCVLLIAMAALMAFPAASFGSNEIVSQDGNWRYIPNYNNDTCMVIGYYGTDADVVIPSYVDKLKVTTLSFGYQVAAPYNRWQNRDNIVSITIPSTVTSVEQYSFSKLPNLTKITIPSSVKKFGRGLFQEDTSLKEFTIPKNMTEIPGEMFRDCTSLSVVNIHSKVTSIGDNAFSHCTSLKKIKLPSSIKTLDSCCFVGSGLESVSVPSSVTETYSGLFENCESLTSVRIPANAAVTEIKYTDFKGCKNLKSVTIPSNIKEIEVGAFVECPNLTTVIIRNDSIKMNGFEQTALLTIYSSSKATKVREYCTYKGIRWRPLDPPKITSKKRTATAATIKWSAVTDAAGYKVYMKTGSGSYKLVKTTTARSYKATGLKKGVTYRFYVTTVKKDALGQNIESKASTVYKTYLKK